MSISVFWLTIGDDFRHEKTEGFVELGSGDDMIVVAIALEDRRGQLANADTKLFPKLDRNLLAELGPCVLRSTVCPSGMERSEKSPTNSTEALLKSTPFGPAVGRVAF